MFSSRNGTRDARLDGAHLGDDRLGHRLGLRHRQQVGEVAVGRAREGQVLAVGRRLEALHDLGDLVEIGEVERHVGADRQPDAVGGQRNLADQIEDRRHGRLAAAEAMIDGDLEHVELLEILARPMADGGAIADADGGSGLVDDFMGAPSSIARTTSSGCAAFAWHHASLVCLRTDVILMRFRARADLSFVQHLDPATRPFQTVSEVGRSWSKVDAARNLSVWRSIAKIDVSVLLRSDRTSQRAAYTARRSGRRRSARP